MYNMIALLLPSFQLWVKDLQKVLIWGLHLYTVLPALSIQPLFLELLFIQIVSIVPLQVHYYSEMLPT